MIISTAQVGVTAFRLFYILILLISNDRFLACYLRYLTHARARTTGHLLSACLCETAARACTLDIAGERVSTYSLHRRYDIPSVSPAATPAAGSPTTQRHENRGCGGSAPHCHRIQSRIDSSAGRGFHARRRRDRG